VSAGWWKFRLSGNYRELAINGGVCEQVITVQVEIDTLEQMFEIENAIATSFENLDLIVEAFHEATIFSVNKKVGDFLPPFMEQVDEVVET
jgi:hypothetical protein